MTERKKLTRSEKRMEKKFAKTELEHHLIIAKKAHNWFLLKTFGILFIVLGVLFIAGFILTKYLNYYFNFPADVGGSSPSSFFEPFTDYNWSIVDNFEYELANISSESGQSKGAILAVVGLFWSDTANARAVTRSSLVINNIANIFLYFGAGISAAIGVVLIIFYYLIGKINIKKTMSDYITLKAYSAVEKADLTAKSNHKEIHKQTIILKEGASRPRGNQVKKRKAVKAIETKTVFEKPSSKVIVKPTATAEPKTYETEHEHITKIHQVQPDYKIVEHKWEKAAPIPKIKKQRKSYPSLGKSDIIDEIYNDLKGTLTLKELNKIYDLTFETIIDELESNRNPEITIFNFGKFVKVRIDAREGINPGTGEKIWIKEKQKIKFSPALNFKKMMEKPVKVVTKTVKTTKKK